MTTKHCRVESTPDYATNFGRNFRAARLCAGLKQSDVAERTGLTQQYLSLIEAGRQNVTLRTLTMLASVVGRHLPQLLEAAGVGFVEQSKAPANARVRKAKT